MSENCRHKLRKYLARLQTLNQEELKHSLTTKKRDEAEIASLIKDTVKLVILLSYDNMETI